MAKTYVAPHRFTFQSLTKPADGGGQYATTDEQSLWQLLRLTLRARMARHAAVRHAANAQLEANPSQSGMSGC